MGCLGKSYLIEMQNSPQNFGNLCLLVLELNCYLVQPITLKLMEDREGKLSIGRHVKDACDASSQEMGRIPTLGRVFLQQWLSRIIENESF
jgi:hypothetical protein